MENLESTDNTEETDNTIASQTSAGGAIGVPPLAGAGETHAPSPSVCSAVVIASRDAKDVMWKLVAMDD
jgi:hypothetical protein